MAVGEVSSRSSSLYTDKFSTEKRFRQVENVDGNILRRRPPLFNSSFKVCLRRFENNPFQSDKRAGMIMTKNTTRMDNAKNLKHLY